MIWDFTAADPCRSGTNVKNLANSCLTELDDVAKNQFFLSYRNQLVPDRQGSAAHEIQKVIKFLLS